MTELTRRQQRELERSGQLGDSAFTPETRASHSTPIERAVSSANRAKAEPPLHTESSQRTMTRREMRQRQEMTQGVGQVSSIGRASALSKTIAVEDISDALIQESAAPSERRRISPPPAVGESRRAQRQPQEPPSYEQPIDQMQAIDIEMPEDGLRGANYLGEPSTQAIVLQSAPEAISLSVDTGEVFTTGSIAILPDPTGSTTGALDGIDLDSEEAVTGVISIVDPVSAKDLIDQRSPLGVVPSNVLRKGWWRPWAVGLFSILMAVAAILASITIFNSLGA